MSCGAAISGTASGSEIEMESPDFTESRGFAGLPFRIMYCSRMSVWMRERERSGSLAAR